MTALELSNGMGDTRLGSDRFNDLNDFSAFASTLRSGRWLQATSKHLEPADDPYRRFASSLLAKQHGDGEGF